MKKLFVLAAALLVTLAGERAQAAPQPCVNVAQNCGPPAGWFLDLNSTAAPTAYQTYTANFMATVATTYLTFALRDDEAFLSLAQVSLVDTTTSSGNLLLNGDFSSGVVGNSAPVDWSYLSPPYDVTVGGTVGGEVESACGPGGTGNCYSDGATQGYDGITQPVTTTIGDVYKLSFMLDAPGIPTIFSQLSTNGNNTNSGGNGKDVLAYEGPLPPDFGAVPEPATLALLGTGLVGLMAGRRRRQGA